MSYNGCSLAPDYDKIGDIETRRGHIVKYKSEEPRFLYYYMPERPLSLPEDYLII